MRPAEDRFSSCTSHDCREAAELARSKWRGMTRVVVIGGGVAGMSAAQELGERGFEVLVLERRGAPGGKARSIDVTVDRLGPSPAPASVRRGKPAWVPGEHGFRFFPGFYKHIIDTMARIPVDGTRSVVDNLVSTTRFGISQYGQQPMFEFPARFPKAPDDIRALLFGILEYFSPVTGLRFEEFAFFTGKLWQMLTSCDERSLAEYEKIPWWIFSGADLQGEAYQKFGADGMTRSVVAAKAKLASARTIGNTFIQLALNLFDPLGPTDDRVLNGPTNDAWISHWSRLLASLGVEFQPHREVVQLRCDHQGVTGVVTRSRGSTEVVEGDYYVCALPVERVAPLMSAEVLRLDPSLEGLPELATNVEWMSGLQLYLRRDVPVLHGHVIHIDTEWALTSISQVQFWAPGTLQRFGNTEVNGIISVDISDWSSPGLGGTAAIDCSRQRVFEEVWGQLQRSLNSRGSTLLRDEDLMAWFLDPDIRPDPASPGQLANIEPLLVNLADTWRLRPDATTAIPNFFLASDYVRTYTDLATMEAANEAARRAVNGILDRSGHPGSQCQLWPLTELTALAPLRAYDADRFRQGLPWDQTLLDTVGRIVPGIGPPFDRVTDVLSSWAGLNGPSGGAGVPVIGPTAGAGRPALSSATVLSASPDVSSTERTAPDEPTDFLARMQWYRGQTLDTIRKLLPQKEPRRHLYDLIQGFLDRPSKGLRPALCLATCRSYGGRFDDAVWSASALEMLHGAFLVHDDIEDGSDLRSGGPTLHRRVGVPLAVNTGDGMHALAMRLFRRGTAGLGPAAASRVFDEVDHLVLESLEGQALELGWIRDNNAQVGVDDYLQLVLKKTGWYSFIHPDADRCPYRSTGRYRPGSIQPFWKPAGGRVLSDSGRCAQPDGLAGQLRKDNRRGPLRGETHPGAGPRPGARRPRPTGPHRGLSLPSRRNPVAASTGRGVRPPGRVGEHRVGPSGRLGPRRGRQS